MTGQIHLGYLDKCPICLVPDGGLEGYQTKRGLYLNVKHWKGSSHKEFARPRCRLGYSISLQELIEDFGLRRK